MGESDQVDCVRITCTRASLANLAPCRVEVRLKPRWRRWLNRWRRATDA